MILIINAIDAEHQPGDNFVSADEAALAWGLTWGQKSIDDDSEYGAVIYSSGNSFPFCSVTRGEQHGVEIIDYSPTTAAFEAYIHSHSANNIGHDDWFSDIDMSIYNEYLVTPYRNLRKYIPDHGGAYFYHLTNELAKDYHEE